MAEAILKIIKKHPFETVLGGGMAASTAGILYGMHNMRKQNPEQAEMMDRLAPFMHNPFAFT